MCVCVCQFVRGTSKVLYDYSLFKPTAPIGPDLVLLVMLREP